MPVRGDTYGNITANRVGHRYVERLLLLDPTIHTLKLYLSHQICQVMSRDNIEMTSIVASQSS